MSIIQKYGAVGENPSWGATGSTDWDNPEYALTADTLSARATFTSGDGLISNYLYIRDLDLSFTDITEIRGIEVTVRKRAVGLVADNYVGLVYGESEDLNVTTPNKAIPESTWPLINAETVYGGPTDLWGREWSPEDFANENFGFVISAIGASSGDYAEIESVRIDIYYQQVLNHVPTGGVRTMPGGWRVQAKYFHKTRPREGVIVGGHLPLTYDMPDPTGGVYGGGDIFGLEVMKGGVVVGGSGAADVGMVYGTGQAQIEFYATTWKEVPPDLAYSNVAIAYMQLDGVRLSGEVRHSISDINVARLRGPADKETIAGTRVAIEDFVSIAAPVFRFSLNVSGTDADDINNGLWYLYLMDEESGNHIRGQLITYPSVAGGGSAFAEHFYPGRGGAYAAGAASFNVTRTVRGAGGAYGAGAAGLTSSNGQPLDSGNYARIGRNIAADVQLTVNVNIPQVGAWAGSTGAPQVTYLPTVSVDGPVVGGHVPQGIFVPVSGGAYAGGSGSDSRTVNPPVVTGSGALAGGTHVLQQTYASPTITGGVRVIGTWVPTRVRVVTPAVHRNYALAMRTPNILNTVVPARTRLRSTEDATEMVSRTNPFSGKNQPGWCDFGDQCGDAYLPAIVKKRQGPYLPPKEGGTVTSDDQIATLS